MVSFSFPIINSIFFSPSQGSWKPYLRSQIGFSDINNPFWDPFFLPFLDIFSHLSLHQYYQLFRALHTPGISRVSVYSVCSLNVYVKIIKRRGIQGFQLTSLSKSSIRWWDKWIFRQPKCSVKMMIKHRLKHLVQVTYGIQFPERADLLLHFSHLNSG